MLLLVNEFGLLQDIYPGHFLHDFHTQGVIYIKGQGFGNKMYISDLITVVGYFYMADVENHQETS